MKEWVRLRKADLSSYVLFILLFSDYGVQCKMYNTYFSKLKQGIIAQFI